MQRRVTLRSIQLSTSLSLSLFLLLPSLPSPPSFSVRRCARVMFSTKRREKDVCNVARACMRKKQTVCTPPRVHERESARGKERTIPHAACNEVYLGVRVIKPLSWFSCRASVTLFTGGKKKRKEKKKVPRKFGRDLKFSSRERKRIYSFSSLFSKEIYPPRFVKNISLWNLIFILRV